MVKGEGQPNAFVSDSSFTDALLNTIPACIKVLTVEGKLLYINPKGAELLELPEPNATLGADWTKLWKRSIDKKAAKRAIQVALAGGVGSFEGFYKAESGTPKWWDVTITTLPSKSNETVERLLVISRDITDRREAQSMLAEKNIQLEKAIHELKEKQRVLKSTESMLESLINQAHS